MGARMWRRRGTRDGSGRARDGSSVGPVSRTDVQEARRGNRAQGSEMEGADPASLQGRSLHHDLILLLRLDRLDARCNRSRSCTCHDRAVAPLAMLPLALSKVLDFSSPTCFRGIQGACAARWSAKIGLEERSTGPGGAPSPHNGRWMARGCLRDASSFRRSSGTVGRRLFALNAFERSALARGRRGARHLRRRRRRWLGMHCHGSRATPAKGSQSQVTSLPSCNKPQAQAAVPSRAAAPSSDAVCPSTPGLALKLSLLPVPLIVLDARGGPCPCSRS